MTSRNLEVILKKAAIDEKFREALLKERSGALNGHELELDSDEKAILDSVPEEQLRQMISVTPVTDREKSFLSKSILTVGIVTTVALGLVFAGPTVCTSLGIASFARSLAGSPGEIPWHHNCHKYSGKS